MFLGFDLQHRGWKFHSPVSRPSTFWSNSAKFYENKRWSDRKEIAPWKALIDHPDLFHDDPTDTVADFRYSRMDLLMERDLEARQSVNLELAFPDRETTIDATTGDVVSSRGIELPIPAALRASLPSATEAVLNLTPSVKSALSGPHAHFWRRAIQDEEQGLEAEGTYEIVDEPPDATVIDSMLVLKIKLDEFNVPEKFKARLVARGDRQEEGVNFSETFAPVAPFTAIRVVMTIAASRGWHIHSTDFTQAYLNGVIDHDIYMRPPPGSKLPPGKVYKIKKGLYGLKQAGRIWNRHLDSLLRSLGFMPLPSAPCVYVRGEGDSLCFALLYVDDMMLLCKLLKIIQQVKKAMGDKWRLEDKGAARAFCGIHFNYDQTTGRLFMHQRPYVDLLLADLLPNGGQAKTPMAAVPDPSSPLISPKELRVYQKIVGKLNWLANHTRPDLSFSVAVLARHMSTATTSHLDAAYRALKYLNATADLGLRFNLSPTEGVSSFTDANWASKPHVQRRSTSGSSTHVHGCLVSWKSQLQKCVSLSAVEAELVAGCEAAREALFVHHLLEQLGITMDPPVIRTDSMGCVHVARDPVQHWRLKHIDTKYHFLRNGVQARDLSISHVKGQDNPADIFTKPVGKHILYRLSSILGLHDS